MRRGALYFTLRAMARVVASHGVGGLARAILIRLSPGYARERRRKAEDAKAFDRQGYDTAEKSFLDGLTLAGGDRSDANPYDATPSYDFEAALAMLDIAVDGATFIDLGSGKGRILILAAAYPFAHVIGVEFAHELQAIAETNLARHGHDPRVALVIGDAARFAFPAGPLIVFLFNPFGAATIGKVATNLHAAWRAARRPIRVIYMNPQHDAEWRAAGFRLTGRAPDNRFALYAPA